MLVFLIGLFCLLGCVPRTQETGTLEGHVTIDPLVPVVRVGEPAPTPPPEVYAARAIVIFKQDGETEFTRLKIDANGNYRAELPVGRYVVDIHHTGIDHASGLPKEVEITNHNVTRLDIDIDTGIR